MIGLGHYVAVLGGLYLTIVLVERFNIPRVILANVAFCARSIVYIIKYTAGRNIFATYEGSPDYLPTTIVADDLHCINYSAPHNT